MNPDITLSLQHWINMDIMRITCIQRMRNENNRHILQYKESQISESLTLKDESTHISQGKQWNWKVDLFAKYNQETISEKPHHRVIGF